MSSLRMRYENFFYRYLEKPARNIPKIVGTAFMLVIVTGTFPLGTRRCCDVDLPSQKRRVGDLFMNQWKPSSLF